MFEPAKIDSDRHSFCASEGWCYDAYPELEPSGWYLKITGTPPKLSEVFG